MEVSVDKLINVVLINNNLQSKITMILQFIYFLFLKI